ncbi:hypothetical protein CGGC5_v017086 [Colletotrichum fructicola Nara gc5]|uniref:Uncharacterized protein n=1 Tax=Colletotrichum fructicola (strain Nara gc5) TaxID=1213859 RepID=A0A7J6IDT9_COLFN|nr:hypothetical protein CGGC5_v017086 [Colletotrichum fructicola Nara gc5]
MSHTEVLHENSGGRSGNGRCSRKAEYPSGAVLSDSPKKDRGQHITRNEAATAADMVPIFTSDRWTQAEKTSFAASNKINESLGENLCALSSLPYLFLCLLLLLLVLLQE